MMCAFLVPRSPSYLLMVTTGDDLPDLAEVFECPAWHAQAARRGADVTIFFSGPG